MDSKLVNDTTPHNLKWQSVITGLPEPPTTDVVKMGAIRQMRRLVDLPDLYSQILKGSDCKYTLVTCLHRQTLWSLRPC